MSEVNKKREISDEPVEPMADLDQRVFEFYEQRVAPGTLEYCVCDAGARHLKGLIEGTKEIYLHFHINLEAEVVTILHIQGTE